MTWSMNEDYSTTRKNERIGKQRPKLGIISYLIKYLLLNNAIWGTCDREILGERKCQYRQ